jgi:hypothetical protein
MRYPFQIIGPIEEGFAAASGGREPVGAAAGARRSLQLLCSYESAVRA